MSSKRAPSRDRTDCRSLADAWQSFRADVHRVLLGLAYSHVAVDAPPTDEHPLALSPGCGLPRRTGAIDWTAVAGELLQQPSAARLRMLGLDAAIVALAEVRHMERARVGPDRGLLRSATSQAWHGMVTGLTAHTPMARLRERAVAQTRHELPPALQQRLGELCRALDHAATPLARMAASESTGDGRFESLMPVPVDGADGCGVHVRIDPTLDGAWSITARRVWLRSPSPAAAPAIIVMLRVGLPGEERCIEHRIAADAECVVWYEERPLGAEIAVHARKAE